MLICHQCLRKSGNFDPPIGIVVSKCDVCHCTGNLVELPGVAIEPVRKEPERKPPEVCVVCREACSSMCPRCFSFVHPYYGFMNKTCGSSHDATCVGSRVP